MAKFIQVTGVKEQGGLNAHINVEYIITVAEYENQVHITVADLNTTLIVEEPLDIIMKLINE